MPISRDHDVDFLEGFPEQHRPIKSVPTNLYHTDIKQASLKLQELGIFGSPVARYGGQIIAFEVKANELNQWPQGINVTLKLNHELPDQVYSDHTMNYTDPNNPKITGSLLWISKEPTQQAYIYLKDQGILSIPLEYITTAYILL